MPRPFNQLYELSWFSILSLLEKASKSNRWGIQPPLSPEWEKMTKPSLVAQDNCWSSKTVEKHTRFRFRHCQFSPARRKDMEFLRRSTTVQVLRVRSSYPAKGIRVIRLCSVQLILAKDYALMITIVLYHWRWDTRSSARLHPHT